MRAGRRDRRIEILANNATPDDAGQPIPNWVVVATIWAEKIEQRSQENRQDIQLVGQTAKIFRVLWSAQTRGITVLHRLRFDGRDHEITGVSEVGRREGIQIDCYARGEEPMVPPQLDGEDPNSSPLQVTTMNI